MAKPAKYPVDYHVRVGLDTDEKIQEKSKILKVGPAVVIRLLIEQALKGDK